MIGGPDPQPCFAQSLLREPTGDGGGGRQLQRPSLIPESSPHPRQGVTNFCSDHRQIFKAHLVRKNTCG
jgi:hypothetical protein